MPSEYYVPAEPLGIVTDGNGGNRLLARLSLRDAEGRERIEITAPLPPGLRSPADLEQLAGGRHELWVRVQFPAPDEEDATPNSNGSFVRLRDARP